MTDPVFETLKRRMRDDMKAHEAAILDGACKSHEEYRAQVGAILAYKRCMGIVDEIAQTLDMIDD